MKRLIALAAILPAVSIAQNPVGTPVTLVNISDNTPYLGKTCTNYNTALFNVSTGDILRCKNTAGFAVSTLGTWAIAANTSVPDALDSTLATYRSAVRNAKNQIVRVGIIGDSIAAGLGTTGPAVRNSWAMLLTQNLHSIYGNHGSGILPIDVASGLWTATGTWGTSGALGPVQTSGQTTFNLVYSSASGASNYALGSYYGDSATVYTMRAVDSGACTVAIDGVTQGTTTGTANATPLAVATTFATTLGYHTLTVTPVGSGNCYLYGAEWTIGTVGVSVHNVAKAGATSRAYGASPATANAFLAAAGAPHLVIISLGVNDWHSSSYRISLSEYTANLQSLITYIQGLSTPSPSIVLLDQHETDCLPSDGFVCNSALIPDWAQMRSAQQALATANNAAFLSVSASWGSYANGNTAGWISSDHVHPSTLGHAFYDSVLEDRLSLRPFNNSLLGDPGMGSQATNLSDFQNLSTAYGYIPGTAHTFFGFRAGYKTNNGTNSNTAFGANAGLNYTTGNSNTAIGTGACGNGSVSMTGSFNLCAGQGANVGASTASSAQVLSGTNSTGGTFQFSNINFLDWQGNGNINLIKRTVGSAIAAAATIAPTNALTHITGTTAIDTITVPTVVVSGGSFRGCLTLIPDAAFTTTTAGNIAAASTAVVNKALEMCYDGTKWYPSY
jgi:lysophospholipase L1-like esterase